MRPRILHILSSLSQGGPAPFMIEVSRRIVRDYQIAVATGPGEEQLSLLREIAVTSGIPIRTSPSLQRDGGPSDDRKAISDLAETIRKIAPSIVHTHTLRAGLLGRMAARKAGVNHCVHTFHRPPDDSRQKILRKLVGMTAEQQLSRSTDRLIAVGRSLGEELIRMRLAKADRIDVVEPLLSPGSPTSPRPGARLAPGATGPEVETRIGFLADLEDPEEVDFALTTLGIVASCVPRARALFLGTDEAKQGAEEKARSRGLLDRIDFAGWPQNIAHLFREVDLVLPSGHQELSFAALQAMAVGRTVIAGEGTPVAGYVEHGRTGIVVPGGDAAATAGAMALLLMDPLYRKALSEAAKETLNARLRESDAAREHISLYDGILQSRIRTGTSTEATQHGIP